MQLRQQHERRLQQLEQEKEEVADRIRALDEAQAARSDNFAYDAYTTVDQAAEEYYKRLGKLSSEVDTVQDWLDDHPEPCCTECTNEAPEELCEECNAKRLQ